MFKNGVLLITGGTGSFGNAVLNRFLSSDIKEIRIFSRDEKKQEDLRLKLKNPKVKFFIGDVRDYSSIEAAMDGVDFVFHAAALKQVPSCEFFPMEAVRTNIIGADNVLRAAEKCNVKKVIVLSTDKAVYPINAMGMTKALMEKVMIAHSRHSVNTVFCGTRYGNVMGSRGSVIPLFIKQIKENKPITVTDPNMTRFMMSLDQAVNLVLFAFEHGKPGDVFVQKSPASTVMDIALALKAIYNASNDIVIIGTRHGEKLYETLVNREELVRADDLGDYYRINVDMRDLNYERYLSSGIIETAKAEEYTSHNTKRLSLEETIQLLSSLEFIAKNTEVDY